jgi:hypothetical protein
MSFLFDHPLLFGSVMHDQTPGRYIELCSFILNLLPRVNHPEKFINNKWKFGFFMPKTFDQIFNASYWSAHLKNIYQFLDLLEQYYACPHNNTKTLTKIWLAEEITGEHLVFDVNKFLEIIRKVREPSISKYCSQVLQLSGGVSAETVLCTFIWMLSYYYDNQKMSRISLNPFEACHTWQGFMQLLVVKENCLAIPGQGVRISCGRKAIKLQAVFRVDVFRG